MDPRVLLLVLIVWSWDDVDMMGFVSLTVLFFTLMRITHINQCKKFVFGRIINNCEPSDQNSVPSFSDPVT